MLLQTTVKDKNVFSLVLKIPSESVALITSGKEFHNLAAATEKALSPYVLELHIETCNMLRPADLGIQVGLYIK